MDLVTSSASGIDPDISPEARGIPSAARREGARDVRATPSAQRSPRIDRAAAVRTARRAARQRPRTQPRARRARSNAEVKRALALAAATIVAALATSRTSHARRRRRRLRRLHRCRRRARPLRRTRSARRSVPNDPCTSISAIVTRPSVTNSVCTVRPNHVSVESGYVNSTSSTGGGNTVTYPNALIRVGTQIPALEVQFAPPSLSARTPAGRSTATTDVGAGLNTSSGTRRSSTTAARRSSRRRPA